MENEISVYVTAKAACFTRPDLHTERMSYEVMPPTAAAGLLRSVYGKPQMNWEVDSVTVLNEIRTGNVRMNEVGSKGSFQHAKRAMNGTYDGVLQIDANADRQQRMTSYLVDVAYIIDAHLVMTGYNTLPGDTPEKHMAIMRRRLEKGQCFHQPWMGIRDFPVDKVMMVDERERARLRKGGFYSMIPEKPIGWLPLENSFEPDAMPRFFNAVMRRGVVNVYEGARTQMEGR